MKGFVGSSGNHPVLAGGRTKRDLSIDLGVGFDVLAFGAAIDLADILNFSTGREIDSYPGFAGVLDLKFGTSLFGSELRALRVRSFIERSEGEASLTKREVIEAKKSKLPECEAQKLFELYLNIHTETLSFLFFLIERKVESFILTSFGFLRFQGSLLSSTPKPSLRQISSRSVNGLLPQLA